MSLRYLLGCVLYAAFAAFLVQHSLALGIAANSFIPVIVCKPYIAAAFKEPKLKVGAIILLLIAWIPLYVASAGPKVAIVSRNDQGKASQWKAFALVVFYQPVYYLLGTSDYQMAIYGRWYVIE